jgi:HPt (histidine-containing phosphotransfer) domain-containing protein
VACIRKHVAGGGRSAAATATAPFAPAVAGDTLDRDVIAVFCEPGGELSGFGRMLVGQFVADAASQIAALTAGVRSQNREVLKMKSHSLKGSALTVGAMRLGGLCRQLELHIDNQPERLVSPALVAAIEDEFTLVRKALEAL